MNRFKTLLIFGAPGSGKGTQGQLLGNIPGFYHCACGDVFRGLDSQSPLGAEFLKYSSQGKLVPDEMTVELWVNWISKIVDLKGFHPEKDLLVLDGIPRNLAQAKMMEKYIDVKSIIHLSCPEREKLIARIKSRALKQNRLDDAHEEIIRKRLATYDEESKPMLEYYGESLRHDLDATKTPAAVLHEILGIILS